MRPSRFDEGGWSLADALERLEGPHRYRHQSPRRWWATVGLARGERVVEIGAGTGFFAAEAARRVGPRGRVYAVDISEPLVEYLWERRRRERIPALFPVLSTSDRVPLPSGVATTELWANVYHGLPRATIAEGLRLLAPRGRLLVIEWKKVPTPGGPPLARRKTLDELTRELARIGLHRRRDGPLGEFHYWAVFRRAPSGGQRRRVRAVRREASPPSRLRRLSPRRRAA